MMGAGKKPRTSTANGAHGSKWIRPEKRLAIYLCDRFTCIYCLRDLHDADPRDITLDHINCRSKGESEQAIDHSHTNLITACRSCNSKRQDKPLSRFCGPETRAHIRRNIKRSLKPYLRLAKAIIAEKRVDIQKRY